MYASPLWRASIAAKAEGRGHSEETKTKIRRYMTGRDRGGFRRDCLVCSTAFRCNPSDKTVTCSPRCRSLKQSRERTGSLNSSWKGGLTPKHLEQRRGLEYKQWRTRVFERDDYTCQKCGQHGGKLQADHDLPFAVYPDLRFEVLNGQTLCVACHRVKTKFDLAFIRSFETV